MFSTNAGYIFECREDCKNSIGVMENFKVSFRKGVQTTSIVCGVDNYGRPVIPAYNDISYGFKPLSSYIENKEDIQRFIKSNKPCFSKFGNFALIAVIDIRFDLDTGKLLEDKTKINFYIPRNKIANLSEVFAEYSSSSSPALVCDRVDDKKGINTMCIETKLIESYRAKVLDFFNNITYCESRENFITRRLEGGE